MRGRLRIGYFSGARDIGGTERYLRELAGALDSERFQPVIIHLRSPALAGFFAVGATKGIPTAQVAVREPGIRSRGRPGRTILSLAEGLTPASSWRSSITAPIKLAVTLVNRRPMRRVIEQQGLDMLHVHNGGYPGAASSLAAVLAGADVQLPTILTIHSMPKERSIVSPGDRWLDMAISTAASRLTTIGTTLSHAMVNRRDFVPENITVISTGVCIPPTSLSREAARARLQLREDVPVIGCIAAFIPVKGHATLIRAVQLLRREFPDLVVVLAGEGVLRSRVEHLALQAGVLDALRFPGVVNPYETVAAFDVFTLASIAEGMPLAVLEAMSQGVPVVATAVGAVSEAVIDGRTGFTVPSNDPPALARRLACVLRDVELARVLGDCAREHVRQHHQFARMVERYEKLYLGLAAQAQ